MENWNEVYKSKLCSAADAVKAIKNDDRVLIAGAAGRPEHVIRAMIDNAASYRNVRVMHGLSSGGEEYCDAKYSENFIHESLFLSRSTRKAYEEGRVKFYPSHYSELEPMVKERTIPINVFMLQVTPPDRFGYCSSGTIADFIKASIEAADVVIAQVNHEVPWCSSQDCLVHIDDIDYIVEYDEPLPAIDQAPVTDVEKKIGENCATLVNDGDTLQVGIGSIPNAVCQALRGKRHLGVHSEMIGDGIMELWKCGAIDGSEKSLDKGLMVAAFSYGSKELYDFLDHNSCVVFKSVSKSNSPFEISKQKNLVCINTCIETDLMGQVIASTKGQRIISGAGGQADFVRGALLSRDGKGRAIIAMTSTHEKNGQVYSRIGSFISEGSLVTVGREDVDYFVTEYGIVRLQGKNLKDRARSMISIAHPDFRPELIETFERRFKVKY